MLKITSVVCRLDFIMVWRRSTKANTIVIIAIILNF
ncbi:MAG: hypothetical protein ACI9CZ_001350, partial [Flavobacterium sp.]